jgi:hypothetical protein
MRSELLEPSRRLSVERLGKKSEAVRADAESLAPGAVDAALEDESLISLGKRRIRRDAGRPSSFGTSANASLLEALAVKLDALEEHQMQIRRLLDQAGHWRLDPARR